jgi:hypothetical protein
VAIDSKCARADLVPHAGRREAAVYLVEFLDAGNAEAQCIEIVAAVFL